MIHDSVAIILITGVLCAMAGVAVRSSAGSKGKTGGDDAEIYSGGLQGASVATFLVVAYPIMNLDDDLAFAAPRDQKAIVALFSTLGGIQFAVKFVRSLWK